MLEYLILAAVIILIYKFTHQFIDPSVNPSVNPSVENYKSCLTCVDEHRMDNTSFINPYIWPYSATERINDLHFASTEERKYYGFGAGPLTHRTEPDHVLLD